MGISWESGPGSRGAIQGLPSFPHHTGRPLSASSEVSIKVEVPTGLGSMVARDSQQTLGRQTAVDLADAQGMDTGLLLEGHQLTGHEGVVGIPRGMSIG